MTADLTLVVASAACCAAPVSILLQWRQRRICARTEASLREALERQQASSSEQLAGLRRSHEELEASLRNTRDVLRHGRLNRSSRAQALHLMRSGMTPETAASTLGIARREMRLLEKVSQILSIN